jgi:hypothetical protein
MIFVGQPVGTHRDQSADGFQWSGERSVTGVLRLRRPPAHHCGLLRFDQESSDDR